MSAEYAVEIVGILRLGVFAFAVLLGILFPVALTYLIKSWSK